MIFDIPTLSKCSIDQLYKFEEEHKKEIAEFLEEWFEIDKLDTSLTKKVADKNWCVKAAADRLANIHTVLHNKLMVQS